MDGGPTVDQKLRGQLARLLPTPQQTLFFRACLHEEPGARDAWSRWQREASRNGSLPEALAPVRYFLPLLSWNFNRNGVRLAEGALGMHIRAACIGEEARRL